MDKVEIAKKLRTYKISTKLLEQIFSIPVNNLSKWLKTPDKMPDKHVAKIERFLLDIDRLRPDTTNLGTFVDSLIMSAIGGCDRILELEAEITRLKPMADSWATRMQGIKEATKTAPAAILTTSGRNNEDAAEEIKSIESEKCPKERDTPLGRKSWQIDQQKRIAAIRQKYGI